MDLAKVKEENLPAEMRGRSVQEKEQYIEQKQKDRVSIQNRINELSR